MIIYRVICLLIGYLFGIFQTGYIYGKLNHIDIRDYGSGNAGTTNAMRILGKKAGIITYLGDMLKGVLCGVVIRVLCAYVFDIGTGADFISMEYVLLMYGGMGVVLGHNYPFYMGFKGGKGIAASTGVALSLFCPIIIIVNTLTFIIVAKISKYVSLASICMMVMHLIMVIICYFTGILELGAKAYAIEFIIITVLFTGLAVFKHRSNIGRLLNGTERKIGDKKERL